MSERQAIILAGGTGSRLRPYTTILPKPLMPIGKYPILEVILKQLGYYKIRNITIAVGYLKELIVSYFQNGERWNIKISYSDEKQPMGTIGPLKLIPNLEENFLLMNGDVLTTLNYDSLFNYHLKTNSLCTIAIFEKPVKIDLGVLKLDENDRLIDYIEKPTLNYFVSMGVYIFNKRIIDYLPDEKYYDIPNLINLLIKDKANINLYKFNDYWLDIGRPADYEIAIDEFEKNEIKFIPNL